MKRRNRIYPILISSELFWHGINLPSQQLINYGMDVKSNKLGKRGRFRSYKVTKAKKQPEAMNFNLEIALAK